MEHRSSTICPTCASTMRMLIDGQGRALLRCVRYPQCHGARRVARQRRYVRPEGGRRRGWEHRTGTATERPRTSARPQGGFLHRLAMIAIVSGAFLGFLNLGGPTLFGELFASLFLPRS